MEWAQDPVEQSPLADCGPRGCNWIRAEALLWWTSGARTPPLLATGTIGSPGSEVLFGNQPINSGLRTGVRVRAGHWFDSDQTNGWEGSFFWVGNAGSGAVAGSGNGSATVIRPIIDAGTGQPGGELVSSPGIVAGFATVSTGSNLFGVELLRRCNLYSDCFNGWNPGDCSQTFFRRDFLIGFRYLNYSDHLAVNENLALLAPIFVPGSRINLTDDFRSYNNFYGLKLGLVLEGNRGPWSLEARPQVSLGLLDRHTEIRGQTSTFIPGVGSQQLPGGLYALSSNIGDYSSARFAAVPELDLYLGYLIRPNLRLLVGYSIICIPNVQRAGEQVDPVVNSQLVPPVTPPVTGPQQPRLSEPRLQFFGPGAESRA